ncbi:MAG TPA: hypothetical protein P5560_14450, partial [Thermotogota bacterium]|nr:hypothetical protein [Thermotogota bacterium]
MKIWSGILVFTFLLVSIGMASPAQPGVSAVKQPDGTSFRIEVFGDEFFHYALEEGSQRLVVQDAQGWWRYARVELETIVPSEFAVGESFPPSFPFFGKGEALALLPSRAIPRSFERAAPTTGTIQVPVILVNFNDRSTTYSNTQFNNLMFSTAPTEA